VDLSRYILDWVLLHDPERDSAGGVAGDCPHLEVAAAAAAACSLPPASGRSATTPRRPRMMTERGIAAVSCIADKSFRHCALFRNGLERLR